MNGSDIRISKKAITLAIAMSLIWLLVFGTIGAVRIIQEGHDDSHAGRVITKEHASEKQKNGKSKDGWELSKGEKNMTKRHYLTVKNKSRDGMNIDYQILDNNDYFDEEFYQNLNITVDDNGDIAPVKINYVDFLYEWYRWLNRNPAKKGLPQISENMIDGKESAFLYYFNVQSYEQQLFEVTRSLYPQYIDWSGNIRDGWELILECFQRGRGIKMVKKLTLDEEVEMLKNYLKKLSADALREATNRNYVDWNTIYKESDRNRLLKKMEQWTWK